MTATLKAVEPIPGGNRVTITETYEIEGQDKPAAVADAVVAYFD